MLPKDIAELLPPTIERSPDEIGTWLLSKPGLSHPPVYRYVAFLKEMLELAYGIAEIYDLRSGEDANGRKEHLRHIGPHEMMYIVNQLYLLHSFDVPGGLLECGVSHAYSTCVLSHACSRLGRTLFAADSFQGLPPTRPEQRFFREGDYACALDDVKRNLAYLGDPRAVQYIAGFYGESLKNFPHKLCLLWLDVDLFESARDVMTHAFAALDQRGVIFTHEFTDFHNQVHTPDSLTPPGAIHRSLAAHSISGQSAHLMRYFGVIGFPSSLRFDAHRLLARMLEALSHQDDRWRAYRDLRECRTTKVAFALNRAINRMLRRPA